jgi:hypothetical protein
MEATVMSVRRHSDLNLPKGIHRIRPLPDPALGALWNSIVLDETVKSQLVSQAMLNFTLRANVDRSALPLHGVILLVGPTGTGKTSLARGLAHRTAESFKGGNFRLLEVEPHTLTSAAMGKTQRAVSELFSQSIVEATTGGPVIVLLDEVETLAADRSKMSMEANPLTFTAPPTPCSCSSICSPSRIPNCCSSPPATFRKRWIAPSHRAATSLFRFHCRAPKRAARS